ncbi:CLUMA_CG020291, isoform A [Clunio marinus]|uniref:Galactose-1-phosphate uridylyltransferase n=1 Tax=Clunio marinus TaxID=568069 RepID=A0A1J1J4I4_9DIPT|nr:CLUMA_CG020291, isoform A [Clunio marinus]
MMEFIATEHQHRRFNPMTGQWILVSPHRMKRPWSGQNEPPQKTNLEEFDPTNPLCPGVTRQNGQKNPQYESTFVFTNDFPALLEDVPIPPESDDPLFQTGGARGTCRVMCFHPKSNKTLPVMTPKEIRCIIDTWIKEFQELSKKYIWVQIFENKGASMGCSNSHPHCQIWSCSFLPSEPQAKDKRFREYYEIHGRTMLNDYVRKELMNKERIVIENPDWLVVVPFWACYPFETMIIACDSKIKRFNDLSQVHINNLAITIKELTTKYDNLFNCSFPYSMGFHGAPTGDLMDKDFSHWTFHAIYYPPLLRSSSVRKFMVGFELLCQPQRDLTPEQAAEKLRNSSGKHHYTDHI